MFLLYKYYSGDTLFIYNILNVISITWPDISITYKDIKKIIINFFSYSAVHWINYIFQFQTQNAIAVLHFFDKKKYNPLVLVRTLQNDLIKLIHIKRENKNININRLLKKYNICSIRHIFFINAVQKISNLNLFQAIKILVKIEIHIKKNYNDNIWQKLEELTIILNNKHFIQ